MYNNYSHSPQVSVLEKIIGIGTYLTAGFIGFIWIILAVASKSTLKPFLRYHIYQSIFLSILYFLFSTFVNLLLNILSYVPFVKIVVGHISFYLSVPIIAHLSIISLIILLVEIYLIIGVVKNKYSYIPWVSDVINYNLKR